jgi:hypothetical protein
MDDIDDDMLAQMSSRELLALQARIHEAIRAQIRMRNARIAAAAVARVGEVAHLPQVEQRRQQSVSVHARTRREVENTPAPIAPARPSDAPLAEATPGNLERERDVWLARKRAQGR